MVKSVFLTYVLWVVGGWLGLHHIYLGRLRQALVWYCTAGGIFGVGWIRDSCRITDYVRDANDDPEFVQELEDKQKYNKTPLFEGVRFCGMLAVGMLFGFLFRCLFPEALMVPGSPWKYFDLLVPFAVAVGVHLVGSIGRQQCSFSKCVGFAYLIFPMYWFNPAHITPMAIVAALGVTKFGLTWRPLRRGKKRGRICIQLPVLILCCAIYSSMWLVCLYHNTYVTSRNGEKVKLSDAVDNFFTSPAWTETKATTEKLYEHYQKHGFRSAFNEFMAELDPEGEAHAYKVLELPLNVTEKDISATYRRLAKVWHPDKQRDPTQKEAAQQKFMQIKQAYEKLSSIKQRREKKSSQRPSDREERRTEF